MTQRLILALSIAVAAAAANAATPRRVIAADEKYAYMCCGAQCEEDYCIGTGPYVCCEE